jgi:2'-5' RNA ligase
LEFLLSSISEAQDEVEAGKCMQQLGEQMRGAENEQFEVCLQGLSQLFKKGYSSVFMTHVDLMRKMMNHFTRLGRQLEVHLPLH